MENYICLLRGQKVILDSDLAALYGVETKVFNQSVRRNASRFPEDFMFQLSVEEAASLRSQSVTLEKTGRGRHSKYAPLAFTEHGVAMLSAVLMEMIAEDIERLDREIKQMKALPHASKRRIGF